MNSCIYVIVLLVTLVSSALAEPGTILDLVNGDDNFSTLKAALEKAGLNDALNDESASLTVFAPTNAAIEAALKQLDLTAEQLLDSPTLATLLKYHVVPEKKNAGDLSNGDVLKSLADDLPLTVHINDDGVKINDAAVVTADLEAKNGVVHVIDKVLLPPMPPKDDGAVADDAAEESTTISLTEGSSSSASASLSNCEDWCTYVPKFVYVFVPPCNGCPA